MASAANAMFTVVLPFHGGSCKTSHASSFTFSVRSSALHATVEHNKEPKPVSGKPKENVNDDALKMRREQPVVSG